MRTTLYERLLPDEVVLLVRRDGEPDPRLERVDLVVELVAREDEPRLDPEHVERIEPQRREAVRLTGCQHRVPQRAGVLRVTEELVAELPEYPVRDATIGIPVGPPIRAIENRNHFSSGNGVWRGAVQTRGERSSREAGP